MFTSCSDLSTVKNGTNVLSNLTSVARVYLEEMGAESVLDVLSALAQGA